MQARIERLGRQRPAKFKTVWTEFGFCFSLLASMIMAVSSTPGPSLCQHPPLTMSVGIFRQWFQRDPTDPGNRSRHPCSITNVARERILSDHGGFLTSLRPPRRHLRWLHRLHVRDDLVLPLVFDRRLQPQLPHAKLLPRTSGSWTCCVFTCWGHAARKHLSPRAEKKPGVQSLWGLFADRLFHRYFLWWTEWTVSTLGLVFLDWIDITVSDQLHCFFDDTVRSLREAGL